MDEFLGDVDEVASAREMIAAADNSIKRVALDLVSAARKSFNTLPAAEQQARIDAQNALVTPARSLRSVCPACGASTVVTGRNIKSTPPKLIEDEIHTEDIYLPDSLRCGACGLTLASHGLLHAVGLGGNYNFEFAEDASEYYQRVYGSEYEDYDEYGND